MKRTKKESSTSPNNSKQWLADLEKALREASGTKTLEEYEKDGWKTSASIREEMKKTGNASGKNRVNNAIKTLVQSGKWEETETYCPDEMGRKKRRVLYRPTP